jgi:hypothetical protein
MLNQLFISYRHERPEHVRAVLRLGELLRQSGIPVALDQFYLYDHAGGPNEGWPKWCEDCANNSACVLIIASEGWFAAYNKATEPGGLGSATEADLFRQRLWDEKGNNARIRLAFLHHIEADKVPVRLRAWHQFRPFDSEAQLDELTRWVGVCLGLKAIGLPTVRWPQPIEFQPDFADRVKTEWQAILNLLSGRSHERILLFEGGSGLGKSTLVRHAVTYASKLAIPVVRVDFKGGGLDVAAVLGHFCLDLGPHLPDFSHQGADKTYLLRKDLRALRRPVLIVFDSYEDAAGNKSVADWICQQLLNEIETAPGCTVIIAGQRVPDPSNAFWREFARHLQLGPIMELEHWQSWIERRYPGFCHKGAHLPTVLMIARGNPAVIAVSCEAIANS